jgi:alpha-galactosidase
MAVHELVVTSLLEGDREAAVHALMLDPLTAAVCSLEEIRGLFDELYESEREFIRVF